MTSRVRYIERFWSYVDRRGPDECWPYKRHCVGGLYGQFYDGSRIQAHRFAYETEHGEGSADGYMVCHTCDNPPCCNPIHLFKGTALDNMRDKIAKGRDRIFKGEECSWSKLNERKVREIKMLLEVGMMQSEIADAYSVDRAHITYIKQGKTWKHVSL